MLSQLYLPFSVIGLTEIKFSFNQQALSNNELSGYQFVSQSSYSNAGGIGFYIRENISFNIR